MIQNIYKFQKSQKIRFKNESLLIEALTHKSSNKDFNNETSIKSEFKYFDKIIKPTEEEIKLHKNFLKKEIKKNYFN